ncbi:MAG: YiaA/YiaB family inner membrane protein [Oscillochloridaceae bacterium umkhey_bin13]
METTVVRDTPAWNLYVWLAFATSAFLMLTGIWYLPVDLWIKGYFVMGYFFSVGSTFTLAKTVRDNYEMRRVSVQR